MDFQYELIGDRDFEDGNVGYGFYPVPFSRLLIVKEVFHAADMFKKTYTKIDTRYRAPEAEQTEKQEEEPGIPAGMWRKCNKCGKPIYVEDVRENFYVCPKCGGYFRVHAWRRLQMVTDPGTFEE